MLVRSRRGYPLVVSSTFESARWGVVPGQGYGDGSNRAQIVFLKNLCEKVDILKVDNNMQNLLAKV